MKKLFFTLTAMLFIASQATIGQQFEEEKLNAEGFEKVTTSIGADFAMQFQSLEHRANGTSLIPLGKGINLPTANFNISADLAPGVRVNLVTYLSSRHHVEAWVKGGYLQMDQLPFINSPALDNLMNYLTLKVGVMEINYGDAHFRRSDNGRVIRNPFVGNLIMDAFTTAPAAEFLFRSNGWIGMAAVTSGSLKPELVKFYANNGEPYYEDYNTGDELGFYWKGGLDKQLSDDFRLRATISGYHNPKHHSGSLYNGDRSGSRYYLVMVPQTNASTDVDPASKFTTGRWGPGATSEINSFMFNLFTSYKGFELFGTYETNSGKTAAKADFEFNQFAIEGLYRFGTDQNFFAGARYNTVKNSADQSIDRIQLGAGWFLTKNVVAKLEYVDQKYNDFANYGSDAGFKGLMIETAISF